MSMLPHLGTLKSVRRHVNVLVPIGSPDVADSCRKCTWTPILCVCVVGGSRAALMPHVALARAGMRSSGAFIIATKDPQLLHRRVKRRRLLRPRPPIRPLNPIVCLRLVLDREPVQNQVLFLVSDPALTDLM